MKRILLLSFAFLTVIAFSAMAQRTVSGKITDDSGEALPGVNVVIKGTTTGVTTDLDGNYRISVDDGATLVFSYVGFETQEIQVGSRTTIDVTLGGATELQEVVVVGYGEIDKRKLTSSISQVNADELADMPVPSFDVALQGKAPGVQVSTTNGLVGSAPKIRIRGVNSISSGTDPLIVVDGVPIETGNFSGVAPNNALADINPADVESYEVLKDGAATAIYGSRAANGVILITTKKGKTGQTNVNYNFYVGASEAANRFELLNADEFIIISNEKFATDGVFPQAFPGNNNPNTDWQDIIFRTGTVQSHNLSFSGGSEDTKYYVSVGYMNQEGHVVNNSIDRYSFRGNIDYTGVKWLDAGVKIQMTQQNNEGLNTGTNSLSGNVSNALSAFPNISPWNPSHPSGFNLTSDNVTMGQGNNLQRIAFNLPNIAWVLANNQQLSTTQRLISNGYAQVNLPYNIKVRTQIGANVADTRDFLSWNPNHGDGRPTGYVYRGYYNSTRWNWQNTIAWSETFSDVHNVSAVVGLEYQKTRDDQFTGEGQEFSDVFFIQEGLISDSYNTQFSSGFIGESSFESKFARVNYDYDGKYLFSASFRRDGLSSLPLANRFGNFLGASVGWSIANESFFNLPVVNDLKIRGGYAETGNTSIGRFPYVGTYGPELYGDNTAIRYENVGNGSLKWETSTKVNIGVDFSLFTNDRLTGSIDWYRNTVEDLVLFAPTPPLFGLPGNGINSNIGSVENSGIEISLNSVNIQTADLTWSTSFNITTNKNEITALAGENNDDVILTYNILRVGESLGSIWGYESAGVNPANGNPLWVRGDGSIIQGNPDDTQYYTYSPENPNDLSTQVDDLGAEDKKVLGKTVPDFYGGMTNNVSYKNFDLTIALTYSFGQKVYNATAQEAMTQNFSNNIALIKDRWTPENTNTTVPRLSYANDNFLNQDGNATSRFLEDGDFVRVQNITVGYSLPSSLIDNISLKRVRVYAQVQNAFVFTGYTGLDPELSFSNTSNQQSGIDFNTNPLARTYTFGINVGF